MADLKTNYVDDVLDTSVNVKRKYRMIQNADGTVSFDDVTTYTQNGDSFGAKDINDTNAAVNELNSNLTDINYTNTVRSWTYLKNNIETTFTATRACFIVINFNIKANTSGKYYCKLNGNPIKDYESEGAIYFCDTISVPLKKGDVIAMYVNSNVESSYEVIY